jgi:heme-degrading monooxygenase HmoA
MITVGMNYHVIEGKQQDFEEKFAAVVAALQAADGHSS